MAEISFEIKISIDEKLAAELLNILKETLMAAREAGPPRAIVVEISNVGGRLSIKGEGEVS